MRSAFRALDHWVWAKGINGLSAYTTISFVETFAQPERLKICRLVSKGIKQRLAKVWMHKNIESLSFLGIGCDVINAFSNFFGYVEAPFGAWAADRSVLSVYSLLPRSRFYLVP